MPEKALAESEHNDVNYRVQVAYTAEAGDRPVWEHGF